MNTRDNRRAMFSVRSVPRGCRKDKEGRLSLSSFGVSSEQLSHLKEPAVEGDREEMTRKELSCAKKTSCLLQ
jgi:hypothetical protein